MATAQMSARSGANTSTERRRDAALRLLTAERSDEILPVLLEEIVALGYPRALITAVDYDSAELRPTVSLNCSKSFQQRFRTSIYALDHPLVQSLQTQKPKQIPSLPRASNPVLCYPVLYRQKAPCWEAERLHRPGCLAVLNNSNAKLNLGDQVCKVCDMRSYAAVVVVELNRNASAAQTANLSGLIEMANRHMARLFKTEHYYNRMSDMEVTIAQMETVMESMSDPVILTDNQHRVIMQNKAAERFFMLPEEVSEGRVRAVELNNMLFSAALSSMAVSGSDSSRDLALVDAVEAEEVLFEAVSAPSFTRDGRRTGMVTVLRDVTELRRADEELRQNYEKLTSAEEVVRQDRDRLNLIIENVGDPIVVCDKDSKIVLLDPLAQELFGSGRDASRSPVRLRNQAKLDAYITAFTYSFSDRESAPLRLINPTSGQEVEFDAHSGKIYDERGQVAYTVTVLRDLTAVRRVEQMKMERRMLEMEKFAAAGRLAGTIAHEVNNPLEAIKNCIYLLANSVQEEAQPVYTILKTETERVARIVRQMLGLYRNTEQVGTFDVNSVAEDTLLLFARQLERAGVRVEKDLETKIPPSVGSADQLRQVFSNLVVNARDSMSQGGTLYLRTKLLNHGVNEVVRILIGDTGCGIPRQMIETMFEPFVTTKGERGTGLGLWIVKGIIENHGGKLRVRSRVGQGTVFKIDIPVVR